jgi:2-oxoglutarate ferredoxin oxidoreductase subunit alpha
MPAPNDFTIKLATANGTGSASANTLLTKAIFRMGVPVMGKNFFPSNIQGLPTWYEIRVTDDGHLTRSGEVHLMVAMNAQTYAEDLAAVTPGGFLLYDSSWPRPRELYREDIHVLGIPLAQMVNHTFTDARTRILMKNIAYVGALAAFLDLDLEIIEGMLRETFGEKKAKLVDANMQAVQLGYQKAKELYDCPLPIHVKPTDKTKGHIVIDGNATAALGCMFAGATVGAWYPITPSTSLMDAFKGFCEKYRKTEEGEREFVILQAEDELSAIGMVVGASWMGARAFTPTSGPGISLMSEFIGYAYYTEIPAVVFDVQRVGPSTGMPTRTQQCDLMTCAYASHGDTRHICLYPADPKEAFEMAAQSFDLAERYQTPVFVLLDLDIGMNEWMVPELEWDDEAKPDRGKVLNAMELEAMAERGQPFHRYADPDGDGVPYRTLPGVSPRGAFFTRGSGHAASGKYTEDADEYQEVLDRLTAKFETAKASVPEAVFYDRRGLKQEFDADADLTMLIPKSSKVGVVSVGSCDLSVREALGALREQGIKIDYCRVRAFPFTDAVEAFLEGHEEILVIEQNRDAQLKRMLMMETSVDKAKLHSILHYNGLPIDAMFVEDAIQKHIAKEAVA